MEPHLNFTEGLSINNIHNGHETLLFLVIFTVVSFWIYLLHLDQGDSGLNLPLPPGSMGLPVIGETLAFFWQGVNFFRHRRRAYGPVYKTHLFGRRTIRIMGGERIRKVLRGQQRSLVVQWPQSVRVILGENALSMMADGSEYKMRKKALAQAFNHEALSSYVPAMQQIINHHVTDWLESCKISAYSASKSVMFDIATKVLLGLELSTDKSKEMLGTFEVFINNLFSLPVNLPGTGLHKGLKAREKLLTQLKSCSTTGLLSFVDEKDRPGCGLELLFAGHQTSASAVCSAIKILLQHPETITKIRHEMAEMKTKASVITYDVLHNMTYLDHVIKEVMRLYPPIGGVFRKVTKTFELDGYRIPEGWTLTYSIRDSHEMETDSIFNPDRWSRHKLPQQNNELILKSSKGETKTSQSSSNEISNHTMKSKKQSGSTNSYSGSSDLLTFGYGCRICPGREFSKLTLKIVLLTLVERCDIELIGEMPEMNYFPVPSPVNGMPMKVTYR